MSSGIKQAKSIQKGTRTSTSGSGYTASGTHNDAGISGSDKAVIDQYKAAYDAAAAKGDTAGMNAAHQAAEAVRNNYGYSGGVDGSQYIAQQKRPNTSSTPSVLPSASSQAGYIDALYDAQREKALAALQGAYDQNMLAIDQEAAKIDPIYQTAKNNSASQYELSRAAFNEQAAASGIATGAGTQARLSQGNAFQQSMSALEQAKAQALTNVEAQRRSAKVNYQNQIAQAIATGDLERASALYQEAVRVDKSIVDTALNQADLDYKYLMYNSQYGDQASGGGVSSRNDPAEALAFNLLELVNSRVQGTRDLFNVNGGNNDIGAYRDSLDEISRGGGSVAAQIDKWISEGKITRAQGEQLAAAYI